MNARSFRPPCPFQPARAWLTSSIAIALIAAAMPAGLRAQVVASAWNGLGNFTYDIHSMPDLDQRRSGLDNSGNMHCVPTAVMNLLAYSANHGAPGMPPYPGVWIGAPGHNAMTGWIDWLGLYMGTTGEDGTTGTGKTNGLANWIYDSGSPVCFVARYKHDDYWPIIDDAAQYATNGAIIQFSYGRYEWQQGMLGFPVLVDRQGGHAVTLKLAFANNNNERGPRLIHYRDPADDDGNLNVNSPFSSVWPTSAENIVAGLDPDGDGLADYYKVTSLTNPPAVSADDDRYRIMDSFLALYPPGGTTLGGNRVQGVFMGGAKGSVQQQSPVPHTAPAGQEILAAIPHPDLHSSLALQGVIGGTVRLMQIPHSGKPKVLATVSNYSRCLAQGFGQDVYVAAGKYVSRVELKPNRPLSWFQVGIAPAAIQSMFYDERTDSLLAVYGRRAGILELRTGRWTDLGECTGIGTTAFPFRNITISRNQVFAALTDGKTVWASLPWRPTAGQPLSFHPVVLPVTTNALAVDFDSNHRMFVSDASRGLMEFEYVPNTGWRTASKAWFAGLVPAGRRFVAFRNRTNIRPGDLDDSQWYNLDPRDVVPLGPVIPDQAP